MIKHRLKSSAKVSRQSTSPSKPEDGVGSFLFVLSSDRDSARSIWHVSMKSIYLLVVAIPFFVGRDVAISAKPPEGDAGAIKLLDELVAPITEPPCSYCSTQHLKSLIQGDDRVIAWLRAEHNGGAFPIRLFLAGPRVVNDTYGLFFYDPDGGYAAAYEKDYGYRFYGWRNGVMVVAGSDGTLWSALTGKAIEGPQKGKQLTRIPSLVTNWDYWLMLHPESTTYELFDGQKYPSTPLPKKMSNEASESLKRTDDRLQVNQDVLGVEFANSQRAYPLPAEKARVFLGQSRWSSDRSLLVPQHEHRSRFRS